MSTSVLRIEIPYAPRTWARKLHASFKRWSALVLHRRAGKTTAVLNHHQRAAMDDTWEMARLRYLLPKEREEFLRPLLRHRVYWHVMPTLKQAKIVAWDMLKEFSAPIPGVKQNNSELEVTYPNGNKVRLIGADDPDSLRGPALSGVSLDEYSQIPGRVFGEILSKALGDHLGYAIFSGTIKGKDQLYDTHQAAKDNPEWYAVWQDIDVSLATEAGATISALRRAMEDDRKLVLQGVMTQAEFDQEWYLSPEAAIKGAIYANELTAARKQGRITRVPFDPALPVDTDWDLGIGDAMACWFTQSLRSGEVRAIDYYEASGEAIPHYAKMLRDREAERGYVYGKHWGPHDITVRELGTGKTRIETFREHGFKFEVTPRLTGSEKGEVEEGINAVRLLLARCWFDETRCEAGLEALRHYRRDFNTRLDEFKPQPVHDWACFTPDTQVLMRSGTDAAIPMAIMNLPENGEVLTPCGWKRYQGPRITRRSAPLVEVAFSGGHTVRCTPDHLFLTESGWMSAESLTPDSLIQSCSIPSVSTSTARFIDSGRKSVISRAAGRVYTATCGLLRLVRFLTVAISTTGMETLAIIVSPIWSVSRRRSIYQPLGPNMALSEAYTSLLPLVRPLPLGTLPRLAGRGIAGTHDAPKAGPNGSESLLHAGIAELWSTCSSAQGTHRNTVLRLAKPLRIVRVTRRSERADTCCIHVPDVECFALANGAVVHNSHAADAYRGLAVRHQVPVERKKKAAPQFPQQWGWT